VLQAITYAVLQPSHLLQAPVCVLAALRRWFSAGRLSLGPVPPSPMSALMSLRMHAGNLLELVGVRRFPPPPHPFSGEVKHASSPSGLRAPTALSERLLRALASFRCVVACLFLSIKLTSQSRYLLSVEAPWGQARPLAPLNPRGWARPDRAARFD
jgi:hypothetical protein